MFKPLLSGTHYQLEAFQPTHLDALRIIASDPGIWRLLKADAEPIEHYVNRYLITMEQTHARDKFCYVVVQKETGKIVGSTRYYNINEADKSVTLGYTWYHPSVWGKGANAEAKYLLLHQFFEDLEWNRADLHVDTRNARSISAVTYLGAKQEGIMRKHMIVQGDYVRDSVLFSIIDEDWPTVKAGLEARISKYGL